MVKEIFNGPMDHIMRGTSLRMTFMVMVTMCGAINVNTKVSGAEMQCMERASSLGVMANPMKEHMLMIKNMAKVFSNA